MVAASTPAPFFDSAGQGTTEVALDATDEPQAPVFNVSVHILVDQAFFVISSEVGEIEGGSVRCAV